MDGVQAVALVVAPIFALIALGAAGARFRLIDGAGLAGLRGFTFGLATPALLFLGGTTGAAGGGPAALAFFIGTAILYAGTLWLGRRVFAQGLGPAGMQALDATFGNSVMMGIPLITAAFGPPALAVLLGILGLHSLVLLGAATVVAELARQASAPWPRVLRGTVVGVARNPVVMAVAIAMLWRLAGLGPPPELARRILEMLGAAAPAAALFCLGGSLVGFDPRAAWREALTTTALKLLVQPALVWLAAWALGLGPLETAVAVLVAALPTGANAFLLASRYQDSAARSGATVLVSTALSITTLSLLIGWFAIR